MGVARVTRAVRQPRTVIYRRLPVQRLFERHARLARRVGLAKLYLVLSFDCDTLRDAEVAEEVHARLGDLGVVPSYAVPGELLERGADVYRRIAATGAEFLNHGYREHTVVRDGAYFSTIFYDRLSPAELRQDILQGAEAVASVVDVAPRGFRVPHFGTFQRRSQLRYLHRLLAELGYAYSSSTTPIFGFRRGPAYRSGGVIEFPVSGTGTRPLDILDSWSFFAAPGRPYGPEDYAHEADAVAMELSRVGAGVLSFYADPSQIYDQPIFFDAVKRWVEIAEPTTYDALVGVLR